MLSPDGLLRVSCGLSADCSIRSPPRSAPPGTEVPNMSGCPYLRWKSTSKAAATGPCSAAFLAAELDALNGGNCRVGSAKSSTQRFSTHTSFTPGPAINVPDRDQSASDTAEGACSSGSPTSADEGESRATASFCSWSGSSTPLIVTETSSRLITTLAASPP